MGEALGSPSGPSQERYTRQNLAKPFFWPAAAAPRGDASPQLIFFTLSASLGLAPAAACCFEICLAIVSKASATLVPSSADASIKSALIDLAKSWPLSLDTTLYVVRSDLVPTRSLTMSGGALLVISDAQAAVTFWKDCRSVTSYTRTMPWAPR